jgi:hypothetical protein
VVKDRARSNPLQLQMIGQIFTNAQQLRIWLGEHAVDSEKLFDELKSHFGSVVKTLKWMDGNKPSQSWDKESTDVFETLEYNRFKLVRHPNFSRT